MPKRIWAASFSEARAAKRMTEGDGGREEAEMTNGGGERGQVRSKKRGGMPRERGVRQGNMRACVKGAG